ncbi:MAG: acetyl-CoA carboxylase biotin carboxyl carrier protein subunit [Sphingobacteriaceae bacterium]|nr:acetyl-CoA carboxylase biotin carboxyl carrier protein subunit [Sphingobacteriaceae bacterium]
MYTINVNDGNRHKSDLKLKGNDFEGVLNEALVKGSFIKINPHQYHLLHNDQSYNVDVMKLNAAEKTMVLKINSVKYTVALKDKYDELLHSLGMDNVASAKINQIKAPMPGMVLNILVHEGNEVKKGDVLLVLEAMKMENMLKSPTDGIIKKIAVQKGNAVEKNQLLIQF